MQEGLVQFDPATVPAYYSGKTREILCKYGPGPRIHFHVGVFNTTVSRQVSDDREVLRQRLTTAQEAALEKAAAAWHAASGVPRRLLDIGCGLGGGSLYWAQEFQTQVTALTVTPDHIPLIADFAEKAGVSDRVTAILGDIHDLREERAFDAAIAIESSGYMDRARLFTAVARALKPGGWFGIQEHFPQDNRWTRFLDGYYKTRLGTLPEYLAAAQATGFDLIADEDLTDHAAEFWLQSQAWATAQLDSRTSPIPAQRLIESALTHGKLHRIWRDHAVETRLLLFNLRRPQ